jgi:hypothetical protein
VSAEIDGGVLTAVPIASTALQEVAVQLVSRLGRRLPPAPLRMLSVLMSYLEACAGLSETASTTEAATDSAMT